MVCASFGVLALTLTCAGLYGIVSFRVAQRTKEVGIRVALGASPATIMRLAIGEGLLLTTLGIVLGSIGAAAIAWVLKKMLFGTGAADPLTLLAVPLFLILSTVVAGYVPARRAAKFDPIVALRHK
jgi:ABC-type antimicrobial peptide transport system permease subunit